MAVLVLMLFSATLMGGCAEREHHRHREPTYRDQNQDQRWRRPNRSHERQHSYGEHVRYIHDDGILE